MSCSAVHPCHVPLTESVSAKIREELTEQGISQRELARRLNVSQPWVFRRLAAEPEVTLNVAEIDAIASALGVPVAKLLGDVAA